MFTMLLLGLGLRIFSCAPPAIPGVKKVIRSTSMEQALQVARRVMGFDSDMETLNYLRAEIRRIMPEEFVE
jgi:phosphoenolpyruvate-protein kinase (PTS system EI component)